MVIRAVALSLTPEKVPDVLILLNLLPEILLLRTGAWCRWLLGAESVMLGLSARTTANEKKEVYFMTAEHW